MTEQPSFMSLLLTEMGVRIGLVLLAMLLAVLGSAVGDTLDLGDGGALVGALVGLALGLGVYALVMRRFNARPKPAPPGPSS